MVDQISVLAKKDVLYRSVPLVFTAIFFLMIAPIPQLQFIRNVDPVVIFSGTLLFVDGLILIVEMFRNLPDARNHLGAKTGAYLFGIMGIIVFAFGFVSITGLYDPFIDTDATTTNLTLTAILGITSIVMYSSVHPMIFHGKRNLASLVRSS
jgi:hypothetical protein